MVETGPSSRFNRNWNDEDVLPPVLSPGTAFVFQRMTDETRRAAGMSPGNRILDVGCGRALDAIFLAEKGAVLFGCEPSRVMIGKAREEVQKRGVAVRFVEGVAEDLPFLNGIFSRVICKGAVDHFDDPSKAVAEMCRVTAWEGRVVISLANFESLSCLLGRNMDRLFRRLFRKGISPPHIWKIPADHTFRFGYGSIRHLLKEHLKLDSIQGVSLFWGFPRWGRALEILPRSFALLLLRGFDKIARWHPPWSDVLILTGRPLDHFPGPKRS